MIKSIAIKDFRSLANAEIDSNWITTFVGPNDAGKSNVLRALNLFFNGDTDHDTRFDFQRDYNQFAVERTRKAKQIEITLTIELPESYQRNDYPETIEWKKVWRASGEVPRLGYRYFTDGREFPDRSKISALLDRYLFTYIPAIKDSAFFGDMQGRLYDVLSTVAERPLKDSAKVFEDQLQEQLGGLLEAINSEFKSDSRMRLPENLRQIFENLEISADGIPLSRRGDGIKIRHIPMMLKFISVKRDQLMNRGGVKYTHIWGFEEPENNVEMSSAFQMAEEMGKIIEENDNVQLFLTTHSPIFYRMDDLGDDYKDWVSSHFVSKAGSLTELSQKKPDEVDESMGLMPIVAPYIREAKNRHATMMAAVDEAKALLDRDRPTVFVEGPSDKSIFELAWNLFSGDAKDTIIFHAGGDDYGGANAVVSRVLAWLLETRHKPLTGRKRVFAYFDRDSAGEAALKKLQLEIENLNLTKLPRRTVALPVPPEVQALRQRGYEIPVDLEALYSNALWARADRAGWLEERKNLHFLVSDRLMKRIFNGEISIGEELDEAALRRVKRTFSTEGKTKAIRHIFQQSEDKAQEILFNLKPIISEIVESIA